MEDDMTDTSSQQTTIRYNTPQRGLEGVGDPTGGHWVTFGDKPNRLHVLFDPASDGNYTTDAGSDGRVSPEAIEYVAKTLDGYLAEMDKRSEVVSRETMPKEFVGWTL
jgi:hypothetical protein